MSTQMNNDLNPDSFARAMATVRERAAHDVAALAELPQLAGDPHPLTLDALLNDAQREEIERLCGGAALAAETSLAVFDLRHEGISKRAAALLISCLKQDGRLDQRITVTLADPQIQHAVDLLFARERGECDCNECDACLTTRDDVEQAYWRWLERTVHRAVESGEFLCGSWRMNLHPTDYDVVPTGVAAPPANVTVIDESPEARRASAVQRHSDGWRRTHITGEARLEAARTFVHDVVEDVTEGEWIADNTATLLNQSGRVQLDKTARDYGIDVVAATKDALNCHPYELTHEAAKALSLALVNVGMCRAEIPARWRVREVA